MQRELSMHEAFAIARTIRADLDMPDRATNASVIAEHTAIDDALAQQGIEVSRPDEYGRTDADWSWWVGQRADGHIIGRWASTQAEIAVEQSLRQPLPLRWLVRDPDHTIHRRYFPKPATSKTVWIFPLTDGPIDEPPVETDLFDLLGDEWTDAAA